MNDNNIFGVDMGGQNNNQQPPMPQSPQMEGIDKLQQFKPLSGIENNSPMPPMASSVNDMANDISIPTVNGTVAQPTFETQVNNAPVVDEMPSIPTIDGGMSTISPGVQPEVNNIPQSIGFNDVSSMSNQQNNVVIPEVYQQPTVNSVAQDVYQHPSINNVVPEVSAFSVENSMNKESVSQIPTVEKTPVQATNSFVQQPNMEDLFSISEQSTIEQQNLESGKPITDMINNGDVSSVTPNTEQMSKPEVAVQNNVVEPTGYGAPAVNTPEIPAMQSMDINNGVQSTNMGVNNVMPQQPTEQVSQNPQIMGQTTIVPPVNPNNNTLSAQPGNQNNISNVQNAKKKSNKLWLIIIIALVVILVAGALGYFVIFKHIFKSKNVNSSSNEEIVENNQLSCYKDEEIDSNKSFTQYTFNFDENNTVDLDFYKQITTTNDLTQLKQSLDTEYAEYSNNGVSVDISEFDNGYTVNYYADVDAFSKLHPDVDLSTKDNVKNTYESLGYTCE